MSELLRRAPEIINQVFTILDLIIFRLVLLGFAVFGAYELLLSHRPRAHVKHWRRRPHPAGSAQETEKTER